MCFGKQIVATVEMRGMIGHVYYTNLWGIPPMLAMVAATAEHRRLDAVSWSPLGIAFLVLSCIVGVAISWTGWQCRNVLSATAYTIGTLLIPRFFS